MPEETTRKLLKQFGMAVTDLEEQAKSTLERIQTLGPPPHDPAIAMEVVEQWLRLSREVTARWLETTQMIVENQTRVEAELLRLIGQARGTGR